MTTSLARPAERLNLILRSRSFVLKSVRRFEKHDSARRSRSVGRDQKRKHLFVAISIVRANRANLTFISWEATQAFLQAAKRAGFLRTRYQEALQPNGRMPDHLVRGDLTNLRRLSGSRD